MKPQFAADGPTGRRPLVFGDNTTGRGKAEADVPPGGTIDPVKQSTTYICTGHRARAA